MPRTNPLLICFSHLRWDFVYQRPQHLLARAARRYSVLFWEEPEIEPGRTVPALRERADGSGIMVATPLLPPGLDELAADAAQRALLDARLADAPPPAVAWFYTPMAIGYAGHLRAGTAVYDCMDELSMFTGASPRLLLCERRLLRLADLVFTGGRSLQAAKQHLHPHVHCFPSAVDAAHFRQARGHGPDRGAATESSGRGAYPDTNSPGIAGATGGRADAADQDRLAGPRIGFFGVLDERLDRDLVARLADLRPDWQFVMIGPVAKIAAADLPLRANLHWLGSRPYAALPAYLGGWDAGIMPFAINDATRFISPTKTPEFLAAGVPVVSTRIADVVADYGVSHLVEIADTAEAMVERLEHVLHRPRGPWLRQVDAKLAGISWDATWAGMQRLIDAPDARKRSNTGNTSGSIGGSGRDAYDWLVVGCGFAGSVLAERIARERGERVLVIDRRPHIAGNAYDRHDAAGLLIHQYGPHIFHTNSRAVADHLSQFTAWRPYEHRVLGHVDQQLVPIPINLDTVNQLFGLSLTSDELEAWFAERAEPVAEIRTAEDVVVSRVGRELYEKFFRGYTRKQWGLDPSQLDPAVTARVPVRTNRDGRYFTDSFQNMPRDGYTAMFERMLSHPGITVRLGTEYADIRERVRAPRLIWTGPVDEYFGYVYGRLLYRSLRFRHETIGCEWYQPVGTVNYPQTEDYTRITEYKHLTGQAHPHTSITYEYPTDTGEPYYPVPRPASAAAYQKYRELADATPDVWFVGRLATYQYMNMDQVVGQALATFRRIQEADPVGARTGTGAVRPQAAPP